MARRVCPNCGTSYNEKRQGDLQVCEECGFKFSVGADKPSHPPEHKIIISYTKRLPILIILSVVVCITIGITAISFHRQETLHQIEALVQSGNYTDAYSLIDEMILDSYGNNSSVQKAWEIGNMERVYEYAKRTTSNKVNYYTSVVLQSIGAHQQLLDWGLYDYTEPMVLDSIQQIENLREKPWDGTTEEIIYKKYNDPSDSLSEPYRSENPMGADDYIKFLLSSINHEQAEQLEKEKYNQNNPLQITEKTTYKDNNYWYCTGTLSNVGEKTYYYVKVKVTYYDKYMNVLTTDWTYAVDSVGINGGENKQFEIMTKVTGDVAKYKIEVIDYQ